MVRAGLFRVIDRLLVLDDHRAGVVIVQHIAPVARLDIEIPRKDDARPVHFLIPFQRRIQGADHGSLTLLIIQQPLIVIHPAERVGIIEHRQHRLRLPGIFAGRLNGPAAFRLALSDKRKKFIIAVRHLPAVLRKHRPVIDDSVNGRRSRQIIQLPVDLAFLQRIALIILHEVFR